MSIMWIDVPDGAFFLRNQDDLITLNRKLDTFRMSYGPVVNIPIRGTGKFLFCEENVFHVMKDGEIIKIVKPEEINFDTTFHVLLSPER